MVLMPFRFPVKITQEFIHFHELVQALDVPIVLRLHQMGLSVGGIDTGSGRSGR